MGYVRKKTGIDINPLNYIDDVADFLVDEIIDPVMGAVTDIVEAAMSDPIGTIAKAYAIGTGQFYLLPYISVASVAIQGGDLGDIAKAAAIAFVATEVGTAVGNYAGTAGTAFEYGVDMGSQQATMIAISEAGTGSIGSITNALAATSFSQAAQAVVLNRDPIQAFISGGIAAGVPAALGKIDGFTALQKSNPTVANVIQRSITAELQGGDVSAAALNALIVSSNIAAKAISQFDPDNKLTNAEKALATNLIINTTTAAVKGGNISAAIEQTLISSAVTTLGKTVTQGFKQEAAKISENFDKAVEAATQISSNEYTSNELVLNHNNIVSQFTIRSEEQSRLLAIDKANRDEYARLESTGADVEVLNNQAAIINLSTATAKEYVEDFSKYVASNQPELNAIKIDLDTLSKNNNVLQGSLTSSLENQVSLSDPISELMDSGTKELNKSFVKVLDPTFNAAEYSAINGLSPNEDPYNDWMQKGRDAGVPTNAEAARAELSKERIRIISETLATKGLNINSAEPEEVIKLIGTLRQTYGDSLPALRAATIKDVVTENTQTLEEIIANSKKPFRVETVGGAYGEWRKPSETEFTVPQGYKLASLEAFDSKQATLDFTSDGKAVWLVPDGSGGRAVWNEGAEAYELPEVVDTGVRPTDVDLYSVAAKQDSTNEGLFTFIATSLASGVGSQIQDFASTFALTFGTDLNNTAANIGKSMQEWGVQNTPKETAAQVKNIGKLIADAKKVDGYFDSSLAVISAIKSNPLAYIAYLGKEGAEEILPIGGGLVAAGIAGFLGAPLVAGAAVGAGFATVIDGLQIFGSSGKEVYDARIKAGDSEEKARSIATLTGFKTAAVTAPVNAVSNALIMAPYLRGIGAAANVALKGLTGVTAGSVGEYVESTISGALIQLAKDPEKPIDWKDLHVDSTFAALISAGTSGVIVSPAMAAGSLVIGVDDSGGPVTYGDLKSGSSNVNITKINPSVIVGKDLDGNNVTLGDLITSAPATAVGKTVTEFTGNTALPTEIESFIDPLIVDEAEARAVFEAIGYKPTQNEINAYVGNRSEAETNKEILAFAQPVMTAELSAFQQKQNNARAQDFINDASARAIANTQAAANLKAVADTPDKNTIADAAIAKAARETLAAKEKQTTLDVNIAKANKAALRAAALRDANIKSVQDSAAEKAAADVKAVADAKAAADAAAEKVATDAAANQKALDAAAAAATTASEAAAVKAAQDAHDAKVASDTAAAKAAQEAATAAAEKAAADTKAAADSKAAADAQAAKDAKAASDAKVALDAVAANTQQINDVETRLTTAIQAAKDVGMQGDAALQAAINSVATEMGVTKSTLLGQLGTTEAALRADMASGFADVTTNIAATKTALEAAIADAKATGLTGDAALKAAINAVAQQQNTDAASLLSKIGATETSLKTEFAAGLAGVSEQMNAQYAAMTAAQKAEVDARVQQGANLQTAISDVQQALQTQISGVNTQLQEAIAVNEAAGLSRDQAISKAVDDVAASVGTTRADLLGQIGATEQSLLAKFQAGQQQTQEQIAGLSQEMQQQYAAMTAAQKAEVESRIQQGQSLQNAIGTVQQALTAQVTDVESRLSAAIAEAEAMGLSRDQAITVAVNAVALDLNTSREALLSQIGQTEQSLKTQFESGLAGISAQVQAQYNALTANQKAAADALTAQGESLQNAINAAKASTGEQIAGVTAEMRTQYESLTTAQKATADALVAQGETFQNALAAAQETTTGQIAGVTAEMRAQYEALTAGQKAAADALLAQGETFQNALNAAQVSTTGQITALSADMQAKYDALSAEQKATADALVAQGKSTQEAIDTAQATTTAQIAGVTAEMQAQYNSLNAAQKATADALVAQGETFQSALALAQATTAGQIGDLSTEMQAQYASLNAAQKATADALIAQGTSTQEAIATAQAQTTAQIDASSAQVNSRINELVAQGKTYQQATEQAFAEVNQLIGTQGRNPNQSDIDALEQMIQGTRPVDTRYDANKDGQINNADIDFLTNLITNPSINEPYFAPTGLYGQLAQSEAARAKDARDAEAARAQDAENQRLATEAAKTQAAANARNAQIRGVAGSASQAIRQFTETAPTLVSQGTQETSTPIYGQGSKDFDFSSPLDFGFFDTRKEQQTSQTGQQATKIATGGYIDDLLAENMTADELLNLLR